MCIMAHPDDIDFGSAGSVARWCSEGWTVYYVLATSGDKGTHDPDMPPETLAATREKEQRAAGEAIGVKEFVFLRHHDGELERFFGHGDVVGRGCGVFLQRRRRSVREHERAERPAVG